MKTFLYILITNFVFSQTDEKVVKANVYVHLIYSHRGIPAEGLYCSVLTRPYISRKFKEGSQCPMIITPYIPDETM